MGQQNRVFVRYIILTIVIFLIYQFVLGTFIRKSCDEKALDLTVKSITPELFPSRGDLSLVQSIHRAMQYHKCINKFMILNIDGRHNIL